MLIRDAKKLRAGDSVKFVAGKKHKDEYKDWAAIENLESGKVYVVGIPDNGYFAIKGKAMYHHPSRFELVKDKEKKGAEDEEQ